MADVISQDSFHLALEHHKAGRVREAERLYRQVLAQQPGHADALHNLGIIANDQGRHDLAADLIRQSIALKPNSAGAYYNLSVALTASGQLDEVIAALGQAIALDPNFAEARNNLGNALRAKGWLDEAVAALRQAIELRPGYAEAHLNLGNALKDGGQFEEAIEAYRRAIAIRPGYAEAFYNLGIALKDKGQLDEAIAAFRQAIAGNPNLAEAHGNLGSALHRRGQIDAAIASFRQAIALNPRLPEPHNGLGIALIDKGLFDEALAEYREAIAIRPRYAQAYLNLGNALKDKGQFDEAMGAYQQAISINPTYAEAYSNIGFILKEQAQLDESIAACRQALALDPNLAMAHSNLIFTLQYHPGYDATAIAEEFRRWNRQYAEPLRQFIRPHTNDRDPDRPLRIGYVSPDFRNHPVGRNLLPWFHLHDHNQFEITCYAHVLRPDVLTRQFQENSGAWRDIVGLSDEQVATQIEADQIDILVDLALHTADNRLLVFARKPAPVQVSYLGYAGSTGMTSIDYRLSDPYLDPPGLDESCYSEKTIRLPQTYWCYQPGADPAVNVSPSPALKNGFITFGCQNNYCKISPPVWSAWTKILKAQPNSKLLVYTVPGHHRDSARSLLASAGVDPSRLLFSDSRGADYFLTYNRIDIALDPFPFNGGTTTCDALWMGVPVITLGGPTAVGRGGVSILSNIGLPELIASTAEQYVQIALDWSGDLDRLNTLRQSLRARLAASPLMNAEQFVRDLESAYRQMWRSWCEKDVASR